MYPKKTHYAAAHVPIRSAALPHRVAGALEPAIELLRRGSDAPVAVAATRTLLAAATDSSRNQARQIGRQHLTVALANPPHGASHLQPAFSYTGLITNFPQILLPSYCTVRK